VIVEQPTYGVEGDAEGELHFQMGFEVAFEDERRR
jgi:hypothetical protein